MNRRGCGARPTEEEGERRRHLDECRRRNEARRIQGLRTAARAVAPPPPPPPRPMTVAKVQHHLENYLPVPAGRCLPNGWQTNLNTVPVTPRLAGQARLDYITALWQSEVDGATEEERTHLPLFNETMAYWDALVEFEHQERLHSRRPAGDDPGPPEVSDEEAEAPPPSCDVH